MPYCARIFYTDKLHFAMIFYTDAQAPTAPNSGFDPLSRIHLPAITLNIPELSSSDGNINHPILPPEAIAKGVHYERTTSFKLQLLRIHVCILSNRYTRIFIIVTIHCNAL